MRPKKRLPPPFRTDQEKAFDRMRREYSHLEFRLAGTRERRWYDCWNRRTGEQYEVTCHTCSCWQGHKLNKTGLLCKHSLALLVALVERKVLPEHAPWKSGGEEPGFPSEPSEKHKEILR